MGKAIIYAIICILVSLSVIALPRYVYTPSQPNFDKVLNLNQTGNNISADYFVGNGSRLTGITGSSGAGIGNCPQGFAVQNTTASGPECVNITVAASGEVDPVWTGDKAGYPTNSNLATNISGLNASVKGFVYNGTLLNANDQRYNDTAINRTANIVNLINSSSIVFDFQVLWSRIIGIPAYVINYTDMITSIGNWSDDKSSYQDRASAYNVGNFTSNLASANIGNYSSAVLNNVSMVEVNSSIANNNLRQDFANKTLVGTKLGNQTDINASKIWVYTNMSLYDNVFICYDTACSHYTYYNSTHRIDT